MLEFLIDVSQIVLADIVLSGDNALIIGMVAAAFSEKERKQIIFFGLIARNFKNIVCFNSILLNFRTCLLLIGALLLYWVCYKFYLDIRSFTREQSKEEVSSKVKGKDFKKLLLQ